MKKPWETLGIGKSTYFRKKAKGLLTNTELGKVRDKPAKKRRGRPPKLKSGTGPVTSAAIDAPIQRRRKDVAQERLNTVTKMRSERSGTSHHVPESPPSSYGVYTAEDVHAATGVVQKFRNKDGSVNFAKLESAVATALAEARAGNGMVTAAQQEAYASVEVRRALARSMRLQFTLALSARQDEDPVGMYLTHEQIAVIVEGMARL
jgi:hypothetical protein